MAINGNSVILQIGKESTYGTVASATKQLKISSESLKPVYNKVNEGLATGGRGDGLVATMGKGIEGAASTLVRADMGYLFKGALGVESVTASTEGYKHTFTCIASDPAQHLPSWTVYVDRKIDKFSYSGCKINRLSLSAASGDYLKADIDFVGKEETGSATLSALTPSGLRAFKFAQAKIYDGDDEIADITNIGIELNNNCDYQTQTTDTGDYYKEPEVGTRNCTISLDAIYSIATEQMRKDYYKTDATLSIRAEFVSDEVIDESEHYKLIIEIPCCQMSDATANMSDPGSSLPQSMTLNAVDNLVDEFVKVELYNNDASAY